MSSKERVTDGGASTRATCYVLRATCRADVRRVDVRTCGRADVRQSYHSNSVTTEDFSKARRLLMRRDPVLAVIIKRHGPCGLGAARDRFDHFAMLVRAI